MSLLSLLVFVSLGLSSIVKAAADRQPPALPRRHHTQARINEEERNRPVGKRPRVARNLAQEAGYDEQDTTPQSPDRQHNHNNHENQ